MSLGADHPSTLTTVHNMALVFDNQGQYDKALEYLERALASREKSLGVGHPSTLTTIHNIAIVICNQSTKSLRASIGWEREVTRTGPP